MTPLPDLDCIEVFLAQPPTIWSRWVEPLMIHVIGSGIVAVVAFIAGLMLADVTHKAEGAAPKQPPSQITVSLPEHNA